MTIVRNNVKAPLEDFSEMLSQNQVCPSGRHGHGQSAVGGMLLLPSFLWWTSCTQACTDHSPIPRVLRNMFWQTCLHSGPLIMR